MTGMGRTTKTGDPSARNELIFGVRLDKWRAQLRDQEEVADSPDGDGFLVGRRAQPMAMVSPFVRFAVQGRQEVKTRAR